MKLLVVMLSLALGGCFITKSGGSYDIGIPGLTGAPVTSTQTPRMNLAETERYYQACVTAVGKLLATGKIKAGDPNSRVLGNIIVKARFSMDRWHLEPANSMYEKEAKSVINDLAGLIRANGGNVNGSWG